MRKPKKKPAPEFEARWAATIAALPPAQRARLEARMRQVGEIVVESNGAMRDVLKRMGSKRDLSWDELKAAARYVGYSEEQFWKLSADELCRVLEYKAAEIERQEGIASGLQALTPSKSTPKLPTKKELARLRCAFFDEKLFGCGMEMKDFSSRTKLSANTLRDWRRGEITHQTPSTRRAIARVFKCKELKEVPE